ncbi:MAG: hypothetical protein AAF570_01820 [Bacteroidota bacterium]
MKAFHKILQDVINEGQSLNLEYQGNPRHIIPLVFGELKNGKEAVLCYKINGVDEENPELSIRLYHSHKISNVKKTGRELSFNRKIDYYLTKHFRTVYVKV